MLHLVQPSLFSPTDVLEQYIFCLWKDLGFYPLSSSSPSDRFDVALVLSQLAIFSVELDRRRHSHFCILQGMPIDDCIFCGRWGQ